MNILFVSEYYPPKVLGGGELNFASLAQRLTENSQKVMVLTSFFPGLEQYEEKDGVKIYRRLKTGASPHGFLSNVQRSLLFPRSIVKEVRKLAQETIIDLIHFQGTSIIAAPKLKQLNKPLFATIESFPALCPKGDRLYHGKEECKVVCSLAQFLPCQAHSPEMGKMKNKWYLKYNLLLLLFIYWHYRRLNKALRHCHLVSISKYVQNLLAQHQLQSQAVIPNIIDAEKFYSIMKEKREKNQKPCILYLGALIESKGPQILLAALPGLDCRCDLYGDGVLKEQLQEMIVQKGLDAEIHPLVSYEQVPRLYAAADIVVYPSLWPEPFGRIPLEAMAAGKLIIASNIGAIPEIVPAGGILFPTGKVEELRQELQRQINNKKNNNQKKNLPREEKNKAKKGATTLADRTYSPDIVVRQWINFYSNPYPIRHQIGKNPK